MTLCSIFEIRFGQENKLAFYKGKVEAYKRVRVHSFSLSNSLFGPYYLERQDDQLWETRCSKVLFYFNVRFYVINNFNKN